MWAVAGAEDPDQVRRIIEEGVWKEGLRLTRAPRRKSEQNPIAVQLAEGENSTLRGALVIADSRAADAETRVLELEAVNSSLDQKLAESIARAQMAEGENSTLRDALEMANARVARAETIAGELERLAGQTVDLKEQLRVQTAENQRLRESLEAKEATATTHTAHPSPQTRRESGVRETDIPDIKDPELEEYLSASALNLRRMEINLIGHEDEDSVDRLPPALVKALRFIATGITDQFRGYHPDEVRFLAVETTKDDLKLAADYMRSEEVETLGELLETIITRY